MNEKRDLPAKRDRDYCGSQWPHKAHRWYDKEGKEQECAGRDRKPGERMPSDPRRG